MFFCLVFLCTVTVSNFILCFPKWFGSELWELSRTALNSVLQCFCEQMEIQVSLLRYQRKCFNSRSGTVCTEQLQVWLDPEPPRWSGPCFLLPGSVCPCVGFVVRKALRQLHVFIQPAKQCSRRNEPSLSYSPRTWPEATVY